MFIPLAADFYANTKICQDFYGLTSDYDWALSYFGGYDIYTDFFAITNIVFLIEKKTNGVLVV